MSFPNLNLGSGSKEANAWANFEKEAGQKVKVVNQDSNRVYYRLIYSDRRKQSPILDISYSELLEEYGEEIKKSTPKVMKNKGKGWHGESQRHSEAGRKR